MVRGYFGGNEHLERLWWWLCTRSNGIVEITHNRERYEGIYIVPCSLNDQLILNLHSWQG